MPNRWSNSPGAPAARDAGLHRPASFHLITRPVAARLAGLDVPRDAAIDALTGAVLHGLSVPNVQEVPA